jgi:hypothetical protein
MKKQAVPRSEAFGGSSLGRVLVLMFGAAALLPGCARSLTITQQDYINTQMHVDRSPEYRTGQPLEVNVVCVYPSDLGKPVNAPLAPDNNLTSDVWYRRRPQSGSIAGAGTFDLPAKQIYLLTDSKDAYGKVVGPRLRGGKQDGKSTVKISGIDFREKGKFKVTGSLFDARAVLYVFPKFIGTDGDVLKAAPAKFHPPGDYRRDLYVEIGVEDRGGREIQYINNTTDRKLGR